jgi:D-alanyl-D-alanine carboxypeptidase (penicillin-binding protein 5/6)
MMTPTAAPATVLGWLAVTLAGACPLTVPARAAAASPPAHSRLSAAAALVTAANARVGAGGQPAGSHRQIRADGPASQTLPADGGAAATTVVGGPQLDGRGVIVNYPAPGSPPVPGVPRIPADAFVVADATTGQVLAAKNPHARYGPASTLKILTAISLIPVLDPAATVAASRRAVSVEPDIVGLKRGYRYKVADLFRGLLLISGNDAAIALTEATGSFSHGISLLNAEARRLGADDTVAAQPNGLDARGQHSSAYDEALIARQALRMPAFLRYDQTLRAWFPVTPRHRIELFNQDKLLTTYRGFIGGKTGWTTPAKATYVGMARRNGHTLIVTLMHAVPGTLFTSATAMLNWGFRADGAVRPVGWLVAPRSAASPAATANAAPRPAQPRASGSVILAAVGWTVLTLAVLVLGGCLLAGRRRVTGTQSRSTPLPGRSAAPPD